MRVLLSGYMLAEGRMSMVLFARTLHAALESKIAPGDSIVLDEEPGGVVATPFTQQGISAKLAKRIGVPLRLRRASYDVLHIIDSDYAAAIPASKLERAIVTCHDLMPFLQREYGPGEPFGMMGRYFFRQNMDKMARCACVVADSQFTRDCLVKYTACPPERIQVIPLAIDPARFRPMASDAPAVQDFRKHHGLDGKTVILHVGAGAWYKNVETVLQVFHRLVTNGRRDLVLLKIGRLTTEQQDLASQLHVEDRIVLLPRLDTNEIPLAYNVSNLLLWPSLFEGFGFCVLEAMACGVPVVCSDGGSLPEVAAAAAAIHAPRDVDALADSCRQILEDAELRQRLCEAGLLQARRFRWEDTAAQYFNVYQSIVST